ncbi:flagellar protein FlgN [Desulfitobacterium sp. AusDCA]|uniref:flagellar protein FlgN n=1 Tax=Desulfitobacterium sp. AusDCA TaxID=3240383 RepID=UPI003DA7879C
MPVIKPLKDNLEKQVQIYKELKNLADIKQKALVENNLQELEAVTVREEQLLLEAAHVEKERLLWVDQMTQKEGKPAAELTLSELAGRYPELENVKKDLETVVTDLQGVHDLNTQLLKQAMNVVNFTIGMLTHQDKNIYQKPGKDENIESKTFRLLDRKI